MAETETSSKKSPDTIDRLLEEILQLIKDEPTQANLGGMRWLSKWVISKGKEIITSLGQFLSPHQGEKIEPFYFRVTHPPGTTVVVDLCVLFAPKSHAEKLDLNFTGENVARSEIEIPCYKVLPSTFDNESLVGLRVSFRGPKPYQLSQLHPIRVLQLQRVQLPKHAIYNVTSTIPVLKQLTLIDCNRDEDLHVYIAPNPYFSTVTILEHFYEVKHKSKLYMKAPTAREIIILGCMPRAKYHLDNISEGTEVRLCFDEMFEVCREDGPNILSSDLKALKYEKVLQGLLASFQPATCLQMCNWCIQLLSLRELRHSKRITFYCRKLLIATSFRDFDLPGITYMLKACPLLEQLVLETAPLDEEIQVSQDSPIQPDSQENSGFIFIDQELRVSLLNLKVVTFKVTTGDFQTWEDGNFNLNKFFNERRAGMRLVMILRANTMNLERMVFATNQNEFIYEDNSHRLGHHTLG